MILMVAHKIPDRVFDEFFERVAEGRSGSSVSKDDDMPAWSTVWRRFVKDQTMMDKYRTALESRGQVYADKLDELDDMLLKGFITESAHRTLSDNIKWRSARMTPNVYGDKAQIDVKASPSEDYIKVLQQVNQAIEMRRVNAIEHEDEKDTQAQPLRARDQDVNQDKVNNPIADAT
jgi:hypothetical protein